MRRDPKSFLWDIQQSAHAIQGFIADKTFEDYEQNRILRSAVERELSIIGEATNRLRHHDEHLASQITNHQRIISLRNIIAHRYDDVRNDLIWATIKNNLPTLLIEVTDLLEQC